MVTFVPLLPVGISTNCHLIFGKASMAPLSQPPSNAMATSPLPSASPHQPSPSWVLLWPRPFLNRSMYHCTAAFDAVVSIADAEPSSVSSEPPCAYRKARPRSRLGLRHIGALRPDLPLRLCATWTSSSMVVGGVGTRSVFTAIAIVL